MRFVSFPISHEYLSIQMRLETHLANAQLTNAQIGKLTNRQTGK